MSDLWITSEGLNVDFDDGNTQKNIIKIAFGNISGEFVSFAKENNKLIFKTNDVENCFKKLDNFPKSATISWLDNNYTVDWSSYNYKIEWLGDNNLLVTVEENYEK